MANPRRAASAPYLEARRRTQDASAGSRRSRISRSPIDARRAGHVPRPVRLRQDDAAAHHRRARDAGQRERSCRAARDISRLPAMRRDYGIVFQSYALFPNLTIFDNVAYGLVNRRKGRDEIQRRVAELLKLVGLPDSGAQVSGPALRRPAAAHRACAGAGDLARAAPARRAALGARRARARAPARRDPRAAAAPGRDHDHGHPRPGRGAVDGRSHRRDEPGRDRAGRHAAADLSQTPATAFVADFVGKVNVLPAVAEGGGRFRVGDAGRSTARTMRLRMRAGTRVQALPASGGRVSSTARRRSAQRGTGEGDEGRVPRRVLPW